MTASQSDSRAVAVPAGHIQPGVVQRVTGILEAFAAGPECLLLQDVMERTGLPRSTAFRMLGQLVEHQWLEHDRYGYRLGAWLRDMGNREREHDRIRIAAADALNQLHLSTGAVAHLGVLENASVRYLDKVGGAAASSVPSSIGARVRADRTVTGRALLACLTPELVDTLLSADAGSSSRRERDLAGLHGHLNWIRQRQGLDFAHGAQCPIGIGAVAAPVMGPEGVRGAISLAGRGLRLDSAASIVAAAARRTSQALLHDVAGSSAQQGVAGPTTAQRAAS